MNHTTLHALIGHAPNDAVVDVEHLPNVDPCFSNLLGVAVSWQGSDGIYIPVNHWKDAPSDKLEVQIDIKDWLYLIDWLKCRKLSGWNIEHDRMWIDKCCELKSTWEWDGRILWYLSDREQIERGYGLKKAQKTILGWPESGDKELREAIAAYYGSVDKGDHYLAPVSILAKYAASDARSTQQIINKFTSNVDEGFVYSHNANRDYAKFLSECTQRGCEVDERALYAAKKHYEKLIDASEAHMRIVCAEPVAQLELKWLNDKLATYKTDSGREKYIQSGKRPKFNHRSSAHRTMLFHDVLKLPVLERTKTNKPKSDKSTIATLDHPAAKTFVELSKNEKLHQFATQYLEHTKNATIHFPHDTVATVSERLGGYAPYDLNMPFSSEPIMRSFNVRNGCTGIHMDLVSIEPCIIAGFSSDPTMLKVYRDGLGDIYLDLCLDLFPLSEADFYDPSITTLIRVFHDEYDTNKPPITAQKEKFGKLRKVAKIIQLAVGYTGTKYTVARNLTQAGFPTDLDTAARMVRRYWQKFSKVETLAGQLKNIVENRGYINGIYGRKLFVPKKLSKDALNRFAQFAGHAILREIVMEINRTKTEGMYAILPDVHDSTSWEIPTDKYDQGVAIFEAAIRRINANLNLPIEVRGEIKQFTTLFGLKNKEE